MTSMRAQIVALLLAYVLAAPTIARADGFEGTLKFRTIAVPATAYEVKIGDETAVGWVTQDQKDLQRAFKGLREGEERMMSSHTPSTGIQAALADNGLPVRVQKIDHGEYRIEELVDVQRTPMSADLFAAPAGFEKTTPQQMMRGAGHGKPGAKGELEGE
jgi:hypothetical protein